MSRLVRAAISLAAAFLTVAHAAAAENPAQIAKTFRDGHVTKYSTLGHPKAKGLNLTISYPKGWKAEEGERPNVVQKFWSEGGRGMEGAMLITKAIQVPEGVKITDADMKDLFSPESMKDMVPPGARFISAISSKIEGLPAGVLEYSIRQERAGMTFDSQFIAYAFLSGNVMVQLQGMVAEPPTTPQQLAQHMQRYKPVFFLMANSIVLPDRYR